MFKKIMQIRTRPALVLTLSVSALSILATSCSNGRFEAETDSDAAAGFLSAPNSSNYTASAGGLPPSYLRTSSGSSQPPAISGASGSAPSTASGTAPSSVPSQGSAPAQPVAPAVKSLAFENVINAGLNNRYLFPNDEPFVKSNALIMSGLPSEGAQISFMDLSIAERTTSTTQCEYYSSSRFVNGVATNVIHNGDQLYLYCGKSLYFNTTFTAVIRLSDIQSGAVIAQQTWTATSMPDPGTMVYIPDFGYDDARQSATQPVFSATRVVSGLGEGVSVPISTFGNDGGLSYSVNGTWGTGFAAVQNGDVIQLQYRKPSSFNYTSKTVGIHFEQIGYAVIKVKEFKWRLTF